MQITGGRQTSNKSKNRGPHEKFDICKDLGILRHRKATKIISLKKKNKFGFKAMI
jgi:hypothetical protein